MEIPSSVDYNGTTYNVTDIPEWGFHQCENITSVTIPNTIKQIGRNAFGVCTNLKSVTLPNSITTIPLSCFSDCYKLESVTLPNSLTSISDYAFMNCKILKTITIPSSVESIGNSTFYYSPLKNIVIESEVPPTLGEWNITDSCTVHIPCGAAESYYNHTDWKDYKSQISEIDHNIYVKVNDEKYGTMAINEICELNQIELTATPKAGYIFEKWSDGSEENPRTETITEDATFEAIFQLPSAIDNITDNITISVKNNSIIIKNANNRNVEVSRIDGQLIYSGTVVDYGEIAITQSGIYCVKADDNTTKVSIK